METTAAGGTGRARERRMTRPRECVVSGVSQGLADHLGWPVRGVRWLFAATGVMSGAGVLLYLWLWALTPLAPAPDDDETVRRRYPVPLVMLCAAAAIALLSGLAVLLWGFVSLLALTIPIVVALALGAIAWSEFVEIPGDLDARRGAIVVRVTTGCSMLLLAFLLALTSLRPAAGWLWLLVIVVVAGAIAVAVGPQLLVMRRERTAMRTSQVRDEQRAEIAAHLHDSVLQTLALIQNRAGASSEVARIARAQERELRDWLYAGAQPAERDLATDLRDFAAVLELDHPVRIEVVVVGESSELATGELASAAREAMLNAARHAGGDVSVYLETTADSVDVFVRDRGPGFRFDEIPEDRLGVRESILGRMRRAGGTAEVRPGAGGVGTEVRLHVDRDEDE